MYKPIITSEGKMLSIDKPHINKHYKHRTRYTIYYKGWRTTCSATKLNVECRNIITHVDTIINKVTI